MAISPHVFCVCNEIIRYMKHGSPLPDAHCYYICNAKRNEFNISLSGNIYTLNRRPQSLCEELVVVFFCLWGEIYIFT